MDANNKAGTKKVIKTNKKISNQGSENNRLPVASPTMSDIIITDPDDDDGDQTMHEIENFQPITTRYNTTQSVTIPHHIPTTSNINTTAMPQRNTSRHNTITSNVQTPTNIHYTANTMPPTTVIMPPPQHSQYLTQPYAYQQYQIPYAYTQASIAGTSTIDFQNISNTTTSRPETPVYTSSSHNRTSVHCHQPLTTTITHTPSSTSQQINADEDLNYLNDTLDMLKQLSGNITTARRLQSINAVKIAIGLYTENQALKEQISSISKRKRHIDDVKEGSIFDDNADGLDDVAEMKICLLDLKHSVKNLTDMMTSRGNSSTTVKKVDKPVSFADIVKETRKTSVPRHQTVISIKDNIDTTTTRKTLAELIQPAKQGIDVTGAQSLSNGKMIIDFRDEHSKNKFNNIAATTNTIITEPPRKLMPTIFLKGVRKDIAKNSIPEMFANFNHLIDQHVQRNNLDIKNLVQIVNERTNFRNSDRLINYGMTVDPKIRDIIINDMGGKIILDYSMVHVEDMSPLRQCYRCYGFNHKAEKCQLKKEEQLCFHCGGRHLHENCLNKHLAPRCINCIKSGIKENIHHSSASKSCPVYTRMLLRIANKIQLN